MQHAADANDDVGDDDDEEAGGAASSSFGLLAVDEAEGTGADSVTAADRKRRARAEEAADRQEGVLSALVPLGKSLLIASSISPIQG